MSASHTEGIAMLTAWDPMGLFDRVVDDVMRSQVGTATNRRAYAPDFDIRTDEAKVVFQLDVPGVKEADIDITLEKGTLTVRGTRKFDQGGEKEQVLLGRAYGAFRRSFALPDHVDEEKLTARLADGVLTIELPKSQRAKPRKVPILTGNGTAQG
jgi:HSP20 family protein